ncbi:MAG: CRISPR-associated protein Cas4 [Planctomycetes bacterium]|nr:CRISPR-associated protein Cas4 [Planctomycetota bacterium]
MYTETELLLLSGLQHLQFCRRQWALIHLEQAWSENQFTAEGRNLHDKVHSDEAESRGDVRIVRGLRLQSLRLGLVGQADVVEFVSADAGVELDGVPGFWQPFPVEYKRGKPKIDDCDRIQLCAQAICLEEMLDLPLESIAAGALFYGRPRRREPVVIDTALRGKTVALAQEMHQLHAAGKTPRAEYRKKKCESCSLYNHCLPKTTGINKDVQGYLRKAMEF